MRIFLFLLALAATAAWAYFYVWAHAMGCAFSTSSNCGVKMPWQMGGEDLMFLVIIPGGIVLGLWALFFVVARRRSSPR